MLTLWPMSSNRSSEFRIFADSQFPNKKLEKTGISRVSEDFLLPIVQRVRIHFLGVGHQLSRP
jgi:hypothetical protein